MASTAEEALKDWWPSPLLDWALTDPMSSEMVDIASMAGDLKEPPGRYVQAFTGLVDPNLLQDVIALGGKVGHDVSTSGPHPSWKLGDEPFDPRFWIWAGNILPSGMEPLVLSWNSANRFVLMPNPNFLMTYGLIPRFGNEVIHWDELARPIEDVVIVRPVSHYDWMRTTEAGVKARREFLQDFATIRNKAMVRVYFARCEFSVAELPEGVMNGGKDKYAEIEVPGRLIDLRRYQGDDGLLFQVWGVRELLKPGQTPVTTGHHDYVPLGWPGRTEPLTFDDAMHLVPLEYAYVRDEVLRNYEAKPGYEVFPESGGEPPRV